MKNQFTIVVVCLCAHVALGGVIGTSPEPEGVSFDPIERGAVYRWGATARNMDSSPDFWTLGFGNNETRTEGFASEVYYDWGGPGIEHPLVLDSDSGAAQTTRAMGVPTHLLSNTAGPFLDFNIQLKTKDVGSSISNFNTTLTVRNVVIDRVDFAAAGDRISGHRDGLKVVQNSNFDEPLSDLDFLLEGALYIDWSGTAPTNDEMGISLKFTQIPEPASIALVIMVSLTSLVIRRRFR